MPIKYAEITTIFNLEKETMMNYFNRLLLKNENQTTDNDTIIILFEDGIICDVTKECTSTKINNIMEMGPKGFRSYLPLYFEMKDTNNTLFSKKSPQYNNGILLLDFKLIFATIYKCIF